MALSVTCGSMAAMAVLVVGAPPAAADTNPVCSLLPVLCPPASATTTPPTKAATTTTKAPQRAAATTTPPTTVKKTTTALAGGGPATVGATGVVLSPDLTPGSVAPVGDLPAPELAGRAVSTTTAPPVLSPRPAALGTVGGSIGGPPNHHSGLRVGLSLIALAFAGLAAVQLPAARRSPDPGSPVAR